MTNSYLILPENLLARTEKIRGRPKFYAPRDMWQNFLSEWQVEAKRRRILKVKSYRHTTPLGNGNVRTLVLRDVLKLLDQSSPVLVSTHDPAGVTLTQYHNVIKLLYIRNLT